VTRRIERCRTPALAGVGLGRVARRAHTDERSTPAPAERCIVRVAAWLR
jgi:hypothetical protein